MKGPIGRDFAARLALVCLWLCAAAACGRGGADGGDKKPGANPQPAPTADVAESPSAEASASPSREPNPSGGQELAVEVKVQPLLKDRSSQDDVPLLRRDGHRRFFTVEFAAGEGAAGRRVGTERLSGDYRVEPRLSGACRSDLFFVSFPASRWATEELPADVGKLRRDLEAFMSRRIHDDHGRVASWFYAQSQRAERTSSEGRISPTQPGDRLFVEEAALCTVVSDLREALAQSKAVPAERLTEIRVGRACGLLAMGQIERNSSDEMRRWHIERIGADGPGAVGAPGGGLVDLAIVDSGVNAARVPNVEVLADGFSDDEQLVRHGTAMALLARHVVSAPEARILSRRVMGSGGESDPGQLARALDQLLFERPEPSRPLVVNLSLGWPPELGRRRGLQTDAPAASGLRCGGDAGSVTQVYEDGVGDDVHYVLDVARLLDSSERPVVVNAAVGNRPGVPGMAAALYEGREGFGVEAGGDPCGGEDASWFYPAQWARRAPCGRPGAARTTPAAAAVPVSAVVAAEGERASILGMPGDEAPIVAPGQHVYAWGTVPGDGAPPAFLPSHDRYPAAFSGSSVSTALVSAAMAKVQALRVALRRPPLRFAELARLVYLTGHPLGRRSGMGLEVRRLDVCRLVQAVKGAAGHGVSASLVPCRQLMECVAAPHDGVDLGLEMSGKCGPLVDACSQTLACRAAKAEAVTLPAIVWDGVPPTLALDGKGTTPTDEQRCGGTGAICSFEKLPERHSAGGVGPQPCEPACSDCSIWLQGGRATVLLEMNESMPAGTKFRNAWLEAVFVDPAQKPVAVDLAAYSDPSLWSPGLLVRIDALDAASAGWTDGKRVRAIRDVILVTEYSTANGESVRDESPLRVTAN